ncbi:hypothetical protein A6456_29640 [Paraburkholderia tropica]|nr:hypothetical protein A6456_29640 [Paraburkholderia tropica]
MFVLADDIVWVAIVVLTLDQKQFDFAFQHLITSRQPRASAGSDNRAMKIAVRHDQERAWRVRWCIAQNVNRCQCLIGNAPAFDDKSYCFYLEDAT